MNVLRRFWDWLFCDHQLRYIDTVKDQDLRSGYKFWSDRYVCRKCNRIITMEHLDRPR